MIDPRQGQSAASSPAQQAIRRVARRRDLARPTPPTGWLPTVGPGAATVIFAAGTYTGYRFDPRGRILGKKTMTLTKRSNAPSVARGKVLGQTGVWDSSSTGTLAGYQVREVPGRTYVLGMCASYRYRAPRPVRAAVGGIRAYALAGSGSLSSVVTTYPAGPRVDVDARAVLNGAEYLKLASGPYAGRWIRYQDAIRLQSAGFRTTWGGQDGGSSGTRPPGSTRVPRRRDTPPPTRVTSPSPPT